MSKKTSVRDRAMLPLPADLPAPSPAPVTRMEPKTGPGTFMRFMQKESEVSRENEQLKAELRSWDGATPARLLDSTLVLAGPWANRHEDSFRTSSFRSLRDEIKEAGGNVQPIKVRPLPGSFPQQYEIVFGHRRHRACLELGLPVLALIESLEDGAVYVEMERENRNRADLSPYEQGVMYQRGVELFGGMRKLAERIGRDVSDVSKATAIASLPEVLLNAFPSRNDIQFRWAKPLNDAVKDAQDRVAAVANAIVAERTAGKSFTANDVFGRLVGVERSAPEVHPVTVSGRTVGSVTITKSGVAVAIESSVLETKRPADLAVAITRFLESK